MFDEFFTKAYELTRQGVPFATATVVRAEKPTSGKPGDRAIITTDGKLHGWIGGSCAQPTVIKEALKALAEDECRLIRLSTDTENQPDRSGVVDLPMTCFSGGTMEIYIEPQQPRPRLLIVGMLPVAQSLAQLGKAMNYHVVVVDLDGEGMADMDETLTSFKDLARYVTPNTYVVVATHGMYDEAALEHLLKLHLPYVGLVASRRRAESVREYLGSQGFTGAKVNILKAPAGLDIHARRGDEIALSIMAEIVQHRRSHERTEWMPEVAEDEQHDGGKAPLDESIAIDPICRMEVEIATAKHHSTYEGQGYYFCCAGCKQTFDANPAQYTNLHTSSDESVAIDPICQMEVEIATAKYHSAYEGQDYYFCCVGCKRTFEANPVAYSQHPHQ